MKLVTTILALFIMTSCNPQEGSLVEEVPLPPPTQPENPNLSENKTMIVTIGNRTFSATLESNSTATAFKTMLPLTLNMSDFNNNEKVCSLPKSLPTASTNVATIHSGDIMLYGASSIVIFYETFSTSYSYTRIGRIDNIAGFKEALGKGNITIKLELN